MRWNGRLLPRYCGVFCRETIAPQTLRKPPGVNATSAAITATDGPPESTDRTDLH
jgi:hypothetical protein